MMIDNQFYKLINLYLSGEISPEDEAELNRRLNASEENRRTFAKLQKLWQQLQPKEPDTIPEFEATWFKLRTRLGLDVHKEPARIRQVRSPQI
ncbi:MAG: anti-sigma factor family protein [bacterium]